MIEVVYYNKFVRCYGDGVVERIRKNSKNKQWKIVENTNNDEGYNLISIDNKKIGRHRLIAYCWKGLENIVGLRQDDDIDHIDGNPLNNSVDNLRIVTNQENSWNKHNTKGYSWDKTRNQWRAEIRVDYKLINLGRFNKEPDARQAYLNAKLRLHVID